MLDLLFYIKDILVFNENHKYIGEITTNFEFLDEWVIAARCEKIVFQNNGVYNIYYKAEELNKYKARKDGQQEKIYTYSGFRQLLDITMYYMNEYTINNEKLKEYKGNGSVFIRKIESAGHCK